MSEVKAPEREVRGREATKRRVVVLVPASLCIIPLQEAACGTALILAKGECGRYMVGRSIRKDALGSFQSCGPQLHNASGVQRSESLPELRGAHSTGAPSCFLLPDIQ